MTNERKYDVLITISRQTECSNYILKSLTLYVCGSYAADLKLCVPYAICCTEKSQKISWKLWNARNITNISSMPSHRVVSYSRPFNCLNFGTPCNFPEVYFGLFSAVQMTFLPFDCRPKSGHFAFWTWKLSPTHRKCCHHEVKEKVTFGEIFAQQVMLPSKLCHGHLMSCDCRYIWWISWVSTFWESIYSHLL
jgi:hypothetical protein